MIELQETLYIGTKWYDVDTTKLTSIKDIAELLTVLNIKVSENYEYFDKIRPYLDIPEPPKSLEEIQKEYDEKYDERIKSIKLKFEVLQNRLERNYDLQFDRIISNFEYAKEHGSFPETIKWCYSTDNAISPGFTSYVIKQGSKHQGYYTFGNGKYFKYYMPDKPNVIVRFFMKTCLGFWWVDEK